MEPGKHLVKTVDYQLSETSNKNPKIVVEFELPSGETGTWNGYFSENALKITFEALVACGLDPHMSADQIKQGLKNKTITLNNTVEITVEREPSYNDPTKFYTVVKWVNIPGAQQLPEMSQDAVGLFDQINIDNALGKIRKKYPKTTNVVQDKKFDEFSDVGF